MQQCSLFDIALRVDIKRAKTKGKGNLQRGMYKAIPGRMKNTG